MRKVSYRLSRSKARCAVSVTWKESKYRTGVQAFSDLSGRSDSKAVTARHHSYLTTNLQIKLNLS